MRSNKRRIPIGTDIFENIRELDSYYVDKTGFIEELLDSYTPGAVSLFTRPRRFGKTLLMTMLESFFGIGSDPRIFEGLAISKRRDLCEQYQAKYPVIFLTLKVVEGNTFETAYNNFRLLITETAGRMSFLETSDKLDEMDRQRYRIISRKENGRYLMGDDEFFSSIATLSELLYKHFGKKAILLIDEYDVPLDYAYRKGYYDQMVEVVRSIFGKALKTNRYMQMAVLTGCLRIAKESIFTGLNNFSVYSVSSPEFARWFGFTDDEVREMLTYYDLPDKYDLVKEWYDGYRFDDNLEMYCPWDVVNFVKKLTISRNYPPEAFWAGTSSNYIIKDLIQDVGTEGRDKIEGLISGETISQELRTEMTYGDLRDNAGQDREIYLWSLMYATGYLTDAVVPDDDIHELKIPNFEIRKVVERQVLEWIKGRANKDEETVRRINEAVRNSDAAAFEDAFGRFLANAMSIRDTASRKDLKENFYQGVLLSILKLNRDWITYSQPESGEGYPDFIVWSNIERTGCVIELKYAENGRFDEALDEGDSDIINCNYTAFLSEKGIKTLNALSVACYKKQCRVRQCETGEIYGKIS